MALRAEMDSLPGVMGHLSSCGAAGMSRTWCWFTTMTRLRPGRADAPARHPARDRRAGTPARRQIRLSKFTELFTRCGRDLLVWTGAESHCLPTLPLGVAGFLGALANLAPRAVRDLYDRYQAGALAAAADLHFALDPLVKVLFVETNPAPAKYVLAAWGIIGTDMVRSPLVPLSEAGRERVAELLAAAKDLVNPDTGAARRFPSGN
jgi:hypothetical protein